MILEFRTLNADEIECRVGTASEKGVSLLLYKDSRADMILLDETVGVMGWKRSHLRDNANCIVSIWDEEKAQWISKEDAGTESNTEKEKGLASDSFKRACVNWGLGRELYTAPFIWVNAGDVALKESEYQGKKKYSTYDRFRVEKITYSNKKIVGLIIVNAKTNKTVYTFGATNRSQSPELVKQEDTTILKIGQAKINVIKGELQRTGISEMAICKRYKIEKIEDMTEKMFPRLMNDLKATKTKEVVK